MSLVVLQYAVAPAATTLCYAILSAHLPYVAPAAAMQSNSDILKAEHLCLVTGFVCMNSYGRGEIVIPAFMQVLMHSKRCQAASEMANGQQG